MKTRYITNTLLFVLGFAINSAYADTVVVVSATNSIISLDRQQVSELFLGKKTAYPDGREAVPVEQQGNALSLAFHSKVLNMRESQYMAYWSRLVFTGIANPPKAVSASEVKNLVANNPNTIGYIDRSQLDSSVKEVFSF